MADITSSAEESFVDKPMLTQEILLEMGSIGMLKDAQALLDAGAVEECTWEAPVLKGKVSSGGQTFFPKINLRSTVFVKNDCSCVNGRKGLVCEHAMALCLSFMDAPQELMNEEGSEEDGQPGEEVPVVRYLTLSETKGKRLYFRIVLPPNLAQTAPNNAMVIKVEARIRGKEIPMEKLDRGRAYKLDATNYKVASLLEQWCGKNFISILQLNRERLRKLLAALEGKPAVYWAHQPDRAIEWKDGLLPGVHSFLEEPEEDEEEFDEEHDHRDDLPVTVSPTDVTPMHVDGSPNFLSIRLPSKDSAVYGPALELLKQSGFVLEPANRRWWLRDRRKTLNFLSQHWTTLKSKWGAAFSNNFKRKTVRLKFAKIVGQAKEEQGRFMLRIELKAGQAGEQGVREALARGQYYVETGKKVILLDPEVVEKFTEAQRSLSGDASRPCTPLYRSTVTPAQFADIESILDRAEAHLDAPKAWRNKSSALKNVSKLRPAPVFKALDDRLRMYQRIGVAWMWHLYKNDLAGILADEMGLGKTVQALALLSCICFEKKDEHAPCLVICPAGLLENWRREAQTFTPGLRVFVNHRDDRIEDVDAFNDYDLVITSYSTLSRDVEIFAAVHFAAVIADEAQHVKNRQTRNAKALRMLRAKGRFLLTGTPMENCLDDLRSLFEFLMPGYLQPAPSSMRQDERDWYNRRLRDQAAPYILRRSKEFVAPELPKKIEQIVYCAMETEQANFYASLQEQTQKEIAHMELAGESEGKIRMAAFNQLLRLRQICADPRILDEEFKAVDSTKLQAFNEILEESVDGGHRILVFSQFVSVLKLLRTELDNGGIPYCYLDGKTRNRMAVVDAFNKDATIPVFLISLKAGGTGLNLTGADRVVHFDPWWNPAVEAQATDRAHRIGQTRSVTSIKLIASDSVEEKVLELQRSKSHLLKDLLDASQAANASISLDDIKDILNIKKSAPPKKKARAPRKKTEKPKKVKNSVDE